LSCTIEANGKLSQVEVIRSLGGGCDQEAIRLIKAYPTWKPTTKFSKPIKDKYIATVSFYKM